MSLRLFFLPILAAIAAPAALTGCSDPTTIASSNGTSIGSSSGTTTAPCPDGGDGGICEYPGAYVSKDLESVVAPACGGRPGDPLPCGACDCAGSMCQVGHNRGCHGVPPAGDPAIPWSPYDGWLCVCAAGVWDCKVQSEAAAICPPGPNAGDAGEGG